MVFREAGQAKVFVGAVRELDPAGVELRKVSAMSRCQPDPDLRSDDAFLIRLVGSYTTIAIFERRVQWLPRGKRKDGIYKSDKELAGETEQKAEIESDNLSKSAPLSRPDEKSADEMNSDKLSKSPVEFAGTGQTGGFFNRV